MEAVLVDVKGDKVAIKRTDGRVVEVLIDRLSDTDQQYVRTWKLAARKPYVPPAKATAASPPRAATAVSLRKLVSKQTFQAHQSRVSDLVFFANGKQLVTAGQDRTARIWDMRSYQAIASVEQPSAGVDAVALSQDGRTLLTGGGAALLVWDLRLLGRPFLRANLVESGSDYKAIAISPDGETAVSVGGPGAIRFFSLASRKAANLETKLNVQSDLVIAAAFSADGKTLATVGADGTFKRWDVETRKPQPSPIRQLAKGRLRAASFSTDGKRVACTNQDGFVVHQVDSGKELVRVGGQVILASTVALSSDGRQIAVARFSKEGGITIYDADNGSKLSESEDATRMFEVLAFSPDGSVLASARDRDVTIWDVPAN